MNQNMRVIVLVRRRNESMSDKRTIWAFICAIIALPINMYGLPVFLGQSIIMPINVLVALGLSTFIFFVFKHDIRNDVGDNHEVVLMEGGYFDVRKRTLRGD